MGFMVLCCHAGGAKSDALSALVKMKAEDYFSGPVQIEFVKAVGSGNVRRAGELLKQGADVNAEGRDGMRPLFWVIAKKSIEGFEFLLKNGADVNVKLIRPKNEGPSTSVMELALRMENPKYLQLALQYGGDPNAKFRDSTATIIYDAIKIHQKERVRALIKAGADLSHQDSFGTTPLGRAALIQDYEMVYILLEEGSDPTMKNSADYDLPMIMKKYASWASDPRDDQHPWYLKVVAEMKKRGLW